jgi:hypothetical protein
MAGCHRADTTDISRWTTWILTPLVAIVAAAFAAAPAQAAELFAPDSVWNARLSSAAPIAADSAGMVAELQRQVAGAGAWINTREYSSPVYTVPASQPVVRMQLDGSYRPLQTDIESVPLPAEAVPAAGSDGHLTVYQPSTDTLWELWKAYKASDGWHARWGGKMTGVSTNPGYFQAPFGATATSLPLLGGLMRIAQLQAGHIDHALALAIPSAKAGEYVWPAQRSDGTSTSDGAIPEGTRLRLDPGLDVASLGLPAVARQMALAAQRYGIVIRDTSGAVTFYGEDPTPTGTNPYPALFGNRYPDQVLARFPWSRLEVLVAPGGTSARVDRPAPASAPGVAPAAPVRPASGAGAGASAPAARPSTRRATGNSASRGCARRAKASARRARRATSRACPRKAKKRATHRSARASRSRH